MGGLLGGKAGQSMDASLNKIDKTGILKSEAHAVAGAASNSAVGGNHFDAMQVLGDNFGQSIGNGMVGTLQQMEALKSEELQYCPIPAEGAYAEYRTDEAVSGVTAKAENSGWSPETALQEVNNALFDVENRYNDLSEQGLMGGAQLADYTYSSKEGPQRVDTRGWYQRFKDGVSGKINEYHVVERLGGLGRVINGATEAFIGAYTSAQTLGAAAVFGGGAMFIDGASTAYGGIRTLISGKREKSMLEEYFISDSVDTSMDINSNAATLVNGYDLTKEGYATQRLITRGGESTNNVKLFGTNDGIEMAGFKRGTRLISLKNYENTVYSSKGLTMSLNPFNLNSTGGILTRLSTKYSLKAYTDDWVKGRLTTDKYVSEVGNNLTKTATTTLALYSASKIGVKYEPIAELMLKVPVGKAIVASAVAAYGVGKLYDSYLSPKIKYSYQRLFNKYSGGSK